MQIIVIDIEGDMSAHVQGVHIRTLAEGLIKAKHGTVLACPPGISLVIHEIDDGEEHPKLGLKRDGQLYELEIDDA